MRFIRVDEVVRAIEVERKAREYRKGLHKRDVVHGREHDAKPDLRVNVSGSAMSGGTVDEWMKEFGFGSHDFGG